MEEEVVEKALMDLGLQRYEAEVYRVLIELGEATVREISTRCSVPREKIYFILKNLENAGIVRLIEKEPKRYAPQPPEEVFKSSLMIQRRKYENAQKVIKHLQDIFLEGMRLSDKRELKFWELGRDLEEKLMDIIEGSSRSLYMIVSVDEIDKYANPPIYDKLKKLSKKGVEINIYTWYDESRVNSLGRLTNVGRVNILGINPWDISILISDGEKGQIIFENTTSIYFINRKMAEFYSNLMIELENQSVDFEELDQIIGLENVKLNGLMVYPTERGRFYENLLDRFIHLLYMERMKGDSSVNVEKLIYNAISTILEIDKMDIMSLINLASYFIHSIDDNIEISYSEANNTLMIEMPWSMDIEKKIEEGYTIPPSPWILLVLEHLRRNGKKEQMTTIIHIKDENKYIFIKHYM